MNYGVREAYFEYFESCIFSRENTNIYVPVYMADLRTIKMSVSQQKLFNYEYKIAIKYLKMFF
jgi:hypothetical protein